MKTISRYLMTLALLITAATGAWAQTEETLLTTITNTGENASFKSGSKTFDDIATVTFGAEVKNDGDNWGWYIMGNDVTLTVTAASDAYTITRVKFYCADGSAFDEDAPFLAIVSYVNGSSLTKVNGSSIGLWGVTKIEVYGYEGTAGPEVTITGTSAEGQQAEFDMPQYDVTATYTIKRDMTVDMDVTVQDAQQNSRFRVQKQNNTFVPVGLTNEQVMALFKVRDDIESKDLTAITDYTVQIFAADEDGNATGTAMTFSNFTYAPGRYVVKAVAAEGSNYSGETALSNVFELFQGYPVEIAAQSFATYYSDEALTLEDSFAETAGLYTISEVTATEAVLSEKIDVMPKRTPMLIYNESETVQTVLLIPTADVAPLTDVAAEFKGTAVEKTVSAEEVAATNFYVLTDQNQFVWVKDAGTIAAHRCWLEIAPSQAAGARRIVFSGSETTGIDAATLRDMTTGDWYDLNGRKLNGMPTQKGVYIFNGRKVVVR